MAPTTDSGGGAEPALARWTAFVVRRRRFVLACWAVVVAGGIVSSFRLPPHLANSFVVPGTSSARAEHALARDFRERPEGTFTVVFRVRHSSDRALQARLRRRVAHAAHSLPGGHVDVVRGGGGVVYADVGTALDLQRAKGFTERFRRALAGSPRALVTGQPAIQHDLDPRLRSDLRRGEALALPVALVVLACVLGVSLVLLVPFVFAACTISAALILLFAAAHIAAVTPYATNLVELIGLGLAVDYSLLIVCRYREELAGDDDRQRAVVRTMATAGRAVVFSGIAVAIGLALLLFVPVPFIRTMGVAGLLIPLVSIAGALTLQPAVLSFCGPRALAGFRLSRPPHRSAWPPLVRTIMRRPLRVLFPAAAALIAAAVPVAFLQLSPGSLASLPRSTEAARGLATLDHAFGPGALTPTEIVVDAGLAGAARTAIVTSGVERLANRLFHDPEVYVVASGTEPPYVSHSGRSARVFVVGRHEYGDLASQRLVERIRARHVPGARLSPVVRVDTGGPPAQGVDFLRRSYAFFPWLVAAALVATYLVLARAFRALLLPLKAVVLNVVSVAAAYGLLVVVVRWGVGAGVLGVQRSPQIEGWIPIFLFATLFGLSMDYEVFLVTRMREAWDAGRDNTEAVAYGLERTGDLITAAALVMAASFGGFVVGSVPGLQQFGLGLALAVLIDATIVRVLLVPSLMAILGRWNWWLPRRLAWLGPAAERRPRDPAEGCSDPGLATVRD